MEKFVTPKEWRPECGLLGLAGFPGFLLLALGFELSFGGEALFFVQRHHAWIVPNIEAITFGFG